MLYIVRKKSENLPIHLSIDAANKKGVHHMVKVISFWQDAENGIFTFELDSNGCQGTNVATADGVNYSLKKIDGPNNRRLLNGVCSDSGGGGIGVGLVNSLKSIGRLDSDMLMATCSLHSLSLILANPVTDLVGLGGLGKKNAIQLLFTCYYLQEEYELDEFKQLWQEYNGSTYNKKMVEPVLTRWEYVDQALAMFVEKWEGFKILVSKIKLKVTDTTRKSTAFLPIYLS